MTSEIFERVVFVGLPGHEQQVPAGLFTLDSDTGVGRFSYGRRYLQRPDAIALDPVNLPVTEQQYLTRKNDGIFGVLGDVLPDSWGKYLLAKRLDIPFGSLAPHEMFDYISTNAVGAISFGPTPEQSTTRIDQPLAFADLGKVALAFEKAMTNEYLPPEVICLLEQGTSLGGAQPKCPVIYQDEEWIAKFENSKTPIKFPRIEFSTMQMAALAGINVPTIKLSEVGGKSVYLIKRFDRTGATRIPFMSGYAVSNLDLEELEKGSYVGLAQAMRKFVGNVNQDLHELFRRMVFNIFVRNQDDHLRNHGFIYGEKSWHLSPLYDVLPIPARKTPDRFSLSLNIGSEGTTATISNIYSRHQQFNLTRDRAKEIIGQVAEATSNWERILQDNGVKNSDREAVRWSFEGFRTMG